MVYSYIRFDKVLGYFIKLSCFSLRDACLLYTSICENYNYYYSPDQVISFDGGRRGFGISGLSGNLKEMQKGGLQNFRELYERNSISFVFYVCIVAFSQLKYLRRIFICKMEKK